MSISSRIHDTIEDWQAEWKGRLRGWMASWVENGIERIMDFLEPDLRAEVKPSLQRLKEIPGLPEDLKNILDKAIQEPKAVQLAIILPYLIALMMGMAMGSVAPAARWASYPIENLVHSYRLPPEVLIPLFRRFKETYEKHKGDLTDLGLTDERFNALLSATLYFPSPAELIHWTAREVFEEGMISKYQLREGIGGLRRDLFYKAGMDDEQIDNHWIAHWEHASWVQLIEMLHRKIITEQDVKDWFPLVEIAPYWAENLIKVAYTWPTRVDVRRWWDMRTIDEARLKELYEGMGYRGRDLEDYIKWTKVYTDFPMMIARFTKGWITEDDIRNWLKGLDIPSERIEQFIQEKTTPEKPAQVEDERKATATEIMKGVKKGLISWNEGVEMLGDLKYDEDTAEFKLAVYLGVAGGSPETYPEFKELTQRYRKAQGLSAAIPPPELIEAGKQMREAKTKLAEAEEKGLKDEKIAPFLEAVTSTEYRYRQLLIAWEEAKKKLT